MITGLECSCILYIGYPHRGSSMCLKHENEIFGANKVKSRQLKPIKKKRIKRDV